MKIIASDFDGTIYIDGGFKENDLEAIKSFKASSGIFGIVTGRSYFSLKSLIDGKINPDFVIANNGSHILVNDKKEMREVYKKTLDKDKLKDIITYYKKDYPIKIFTDLDRKIDSLDDLKKYEKVYSLAIYSDDFLDNPFKDLFSFHKSIGVIDVIDKDISKQTGIAFIKKFYAYDKDIIAIGDDYNDISFLKETPLSFTLNYVTEESVVDVCNHRVEDISELIEKYGQ